MICLIKTIFNAVYNIIRDFYTKVFIQVWQKNITCHTCIKAIKLGKIFATKSEEAFTKTGFQNWKKALEKNSGLAKHNDSNSHKKASEDLMKASDYGTNDVCELLDDKLLQQQLKN